MIDVTTPDERTIVINGTRIDLGKRAYRMITLPDRLIVLLHTSDHDYGEPMVGRNVLCYGADGELLWRVADHGCVIHARHDDPVTQPDEEGERRVPQSVMGMFVDEDTGKIKIGLPRWHYTLNPETGELSDMEYNR